MRAEESGRERDTGARIVSSHSNEDTSRAADQAPDVCSSLRRSPAPSDNLDPPPAAGKFTPANRAQIPATIVHAPRPGVAPASAAGELASYSAIQAVPRPSASRPKRRRSAIATSRLHAANGEARWLLTPRARDVRTTWLARGRRERS